MRGMFIPSTQVHIQRCVDARRGLRAPIEARCTVCRDQTANWRTAKWTDTHSDPQHCLAQALISFGSALALPKIISEISRKRDNLFSFRRQRLIPSKVSS